MSCGRPKPILVLLSILLLPLLVSAQDNSSQIVHTVISEPLTLDGHLEPAWFKVDPITLDHQIEPEEGDPPSYPTRVFVLYTNEALYVAYDCFDAAPDSIAGRVQRRDNDSNSDVVALYLDTFRDRRSGYYFGVTAAGVQFDGTWNNETDRDDTWDGIWESAVTQNDSGYVVEMRIPFQSIRHGGPLPGGWGFNAMRWLERNVELISWAKFDRPTGNRVNVWGTLLGLDEIESARHIEILPHAVGRWDADDGGKWHSVNEWENIGIDLKLVPSSTWTLDLTYQPDFAQVDVDDEVINLSDYPIYLEEKRPFFLESLGLFNGIPIRMLYTRKIADPDFGARVTGQKGSTRSSILAARNQTEDGMLQAAFAGRAVRNLGRASSIGLTSTSLSDTSFHAHTAAVDGRIRWGKEHEVTLFAAGLDKQVREHLDTFEDVNGNDSTVVVPTDDYENQPVALRGTLFLAFNKWRGSTGVTYTGQDFDVNDLGFTGYSNTISNSFWIQRVIYLPKGSVVDAMRHNINYWQEIFPDGSHWEKGGNYNGYARFANNWYFGGGLGAGDGYFRYTYDADDGDDIADFPYRHNFGPYRIEYFLWHSQWLWFNSDYRKPVGFSMNIENATLRDGFRRAVDSDIQWKVLPNLELNLNHTYIQVEDVSDRHAGSLTDYSILRLKSRWSPTLDLSLRATIQLVNDMVREHDLEDENAILFNMLVAYNYSPGSWFYIVYDDTRDWYVDDGETIGRWNVGDRTIRMKWTWFVSVP
ncbi:carbohydrate binding family 9 domain-containing protein [bacterium]|nr:carbohydrate binding family 9 domain-containing protein [bacterium]